MTRPAMAVPIALLVSALTACRPDEPRPPAAGASAVAAVASGPQDTAFAGTTAPVHRARPTRPGVPLAMLRAVETGSSPGYDRVVFQFTGDSAPGYHVRSEEHTSELQSRGHLVCRLLLEKKKKKHEY